MRSSPIFLIGLVLFFSACVKDKPGPVTPQVITYSGSKKIFVLNEGNFGSGNGSLSLYDQGNGTVVEDFFKAQNATAAGDVIQSMSKVNRSYCLVANNSGKIWICDENIKAVALVSGLPSPRYVLGVTPQKAYISDLAANGIHVLDLNTNTVLKKIPCAGWTEQMVLLYGKVFVTNMRSNYLYVINLTTDQITDSIYVGINAASIVADKMAKIWVLSSGEAADNQPATLSRIDPVSHAVELKLALPEKNPASGLCINGSRDMLYFLHGDIYRQPIANNTTPSVFIVNSNRNFYGLGVDPDNEKVYVSDALDFSQRSNIYVYDKQGREEKSFKAGVNSNGFYFE